MSILSNILRDLLSVIYPPKCLMCGEELHLADSEICTDCFSRVSYTRFWEYSDNPMSGRVRDLQPMVREACAMFFYDNHCRDMIHRLKYRAEWRTARYMGEIFGSYLSRSDIYSNVDIVIPAPLHAIRRMARGYNQSEYIARGIASKLGAKVDTHTLYRSRHTIAQVKKTKVERWTGGENLFEVRDIERLRGKHILLVDDVYTTGATIFRCIEAIHRSLPECEISVATLATPRK